MLKSRVFVRLPYREFRQKIWYMKKLIPIVAAAFVFVGCDNGNNDLVDDTEDAFEETGESIEEGVDDAGDTLENAAEETKEGIEEGAEEIEEEID